MRKNQGEKGKTFQRDEGARRLRLHFLVVLRTSEQSLNEGGGARETHENLSKYYFVVKRLSIAHFWLTKRITDGRTGRQTD